MKRDTVTKFVTSAKTTWRKKIVPNRSHLRMAQMILFVVLLFGGIFGYKFIKIFFTTHQVPPPVSVSSTFVKTEEWQSKIRSVGTLQAIQGVDITTELAGKVKKIHLTSGGRVNTDDILVELNTDAEIAQRDSLRAIVELAEITYTRNKSQFAAGAISQATLDFDRTDLENKKGQLAQQEAILAKKIIRAPFAGILGISAVNLGQYLNTGDKIITLQSLDPIYVDFSLPQQAIGSIKVGQKVTLKIDTYGEKLFEGEITSIDPKVDATTRNILIEATIPNPDSKLYPGMFGEIEVYTGTSRNALVLPKMAISFNPFGEIVYVIQQSTKDKSRLSVKQTFVTVGESRDNQTVILKGIKEGDQVVTAGQLKLKNGTAVRINNSIQPDTSTVPEPVDE